VEKQLDRAASPVWCPGRMNEPSELADGCVPAGAGQEYVPHEGIFLRSNTRSSGPMATATPCRWTAMSACADSAAPLIGGLGAAWVVWVGVRGVGFGERRRKDGEAGEEALRKRGGGLGQRARDRFWGAAASAQEGADRRGAAFSRSAKGRHVFLSRD
jgi:hypothetical protein